MQLSIGIVGAGAVTTGSHLPALAAIPDVTVTWICDRAVKAAEAAARTYGVKGWYANLDDCPHADVVLVATPVSTRTTLIPAILERGSSVFCEKPFALDPAHHDRFVALADAKGVQLGVGQVRRFAGPTATLKRIIADGTFGTVTRASAIEGMEVHNTGRSGDWHIADTAYKTGVLMETGSHLVDQLLYVLDAVDGDVTSVARVERRGIDLESRVHATLALAGGRTIPALFELSMLQDLSNGLYVEFEHVLLHAGVFFGDKVSIIDKRGSRLCEIVQTDGINSDAHAFTVEWVDFLQQCRSRVPSRLDARSVRTTTKLIHGAYAFEQLATVAS